MVHHFFPVMSPVNAKMGMLLACWRNTEPMQKLWTRYDKFDADTNDCKGPSRNDVSQGVKGGGGKNWRPSIGGRGLKSQAWDHFERMVDRQGEGEGEGGGGGGGVKLGS